MKYLKGKNLKTKRQKYREARQKKRARKEKILRIKIVRLIERQIEKDPQRARDRQKESNRKSINQIIEAANGKSQLGSARRQIPKRIRKIFQR